MPHWPANSQWNSVLGQGCSDLRLQDAVTVYDAAGLRVDPRCVVRMRSDAHEPAQAFGRQLGIAVECHDVARVRCNLRQLCHIQKRCAVAGGQCVHQLFELAAFALPSDPALFGLAEPTRPVQHQKPRRHARQWRVAQVQCAQLRAGCFEQGGVCCHLLLVGIGPVAQQCELGLRLRIGQVVQLQAVCKVGHALKAREHRWDHHHHPVFRPNPVLERQPRQQPRLHRFADQPVDKRDNGLRGRKCHQQDADQRQPPGFVRRRWQQPGHQAHGAKPQHAEIGRQHCMAPHLAPYRGELVVQAQRNHQGGFPRACKPVAGHRLFSGMGLHQPQQRGGHGDLAMAAAPCQTFDRMQGLVARDDGFGIERLAAAQQAHQTAAALDDVTPVGITDRAQRVHGVADTQVVCGLLGRLPAPERSRIRLGLLQPCLLQRVVPAVRVLESLRQLGQERGRHGQRLKPRPPMLQLCHGSGGDSVAAQICSLARGFLVRLALGQTAQVFDQYHAQCGGQCPHFPQFERARLLVREQKLHQQVFVERAVGMRDKGPGNAVDPRQTFQRRLQQNRQGAKVAARQTLVHLVQLGVDQMKVVEQPLRGRAGVVPGGGLLPDIPVGLAQHLDIAAQARKEAA